MDYAAMLMKLVGWFMLGRMDRRGFVFGMIGSTCMIYPAIKVGLYSAAIYFACTLVLQVVAYRNWGKPCQSNTDV